MQNLTLQHLTLLESIQGLIIMDATGGRHFVTMADAGSFAVCDHPTAKFLSSHVATQQLKAVLKLRFSNKKTMQERALLYFMDRGAYDLCIDQGNQVDPVIDENGFEEVRRPGTTMLMRVVVIQETSKRSSREKIACPACEHINTNSADSSGFPIDWCVSQALTSDSFPLLISRKQSSLRCSDSTVG